MVDFEQAVKEYVASLEAFRAEHELPEEWFAVPDHVAVKCAGAEDYEQTVAAWLPKSQELSYITLDGRRLASAHLKTPVSLGSFGAVEWLEIMEPRPEKAGQDTVGIDHTEFLFPDFAAAEAVLQAKNIPYKPQSNPGHGWLTIVINPAGQELKLNNGVLADIVEHEKQKGLTTIL